MALREPRQYSEPEDIYTFPTITPNLKYVYNPNDPSGFFWALCRLFECKSEHLVNEMDFFASLDIERFSELIAELVCNDCTDIKDSTCRVLRLQNSSARLLKELEDKFNSRDISDRDYNYFKKDFELQANILSRLYWLVSDYCNSVIDAETKEVMLELQSKLERKPKRHTIIHISAFFKES